MRSRLLLRLTPLVFALLSGCTYIDNMMARVASWRYSNRIYLGTGTAVNVGRHDDRDRYACRANRLLVCRSVGMTFDCSCE